MDYFALALPRLAPMVRKKGRSNIERGGIFRQLQNLLFGETETVQWVAIFASVKNQDVYRVAARPLEGKCGRTLAPRVSVKGWRTRRETIIREK